MSGPDHLRYTYILSLDLTKEREKKKGIVRGISFIIVKNNEITHKVKSLQGELKR